MQANNDNHTYNNAIARVVTLVAVLAALITTTTTTTSLAHHSFTAEFDADAPVLLKGKVTKVEWINPHAWIHLEVVQKDGTTVAWMVEGGTPNLHYS